MKDDLGPKNTWQTSADAPSHAGISYGLITSGKATAVVFGYTYGGVVS